MDYTSLIAPKGTAGSIANWINYSDAILPLADILDDAQALLFRGGAAASASINPLRVQDMIETGVTLNVAAGAVSAARPSDFLGLLRMADQNNVEVKMKDVSSLIDRRAYDTSGNPLQGNSPAHVALGNEGGAPMFLFDIAPNANIVMTYAYFKEPARLSGGNTTNFLTTKFPHLLRAACLAVAADFLSDDAKYTRAVNRLATALNGINIAEDMMLAGMSIDRTY